MTAQNGAIMLVGTRKGLWIGRSDDARTHWEWDDPHFLMSEVASCAIDTRGEQPRLLVGAMSWHWGPQVLYSDDLGKTWKGEEASAVAFPKDTGSSLERVWQLAPGPADQPGTMYAGTEPSALFRSTDGGQSFDMVRGLWDHPHRPNWHPGGGGQAIHTVLPHPTDAQQVTVAMSTGGVYRTSDGGTSWAPANKGIVADFFPEDQQPEYGQCVHKVTRHATAPDRLFAQNHGGVYRSDDAGDSWHSIAGGLSSDFGFPMVVHPDDPNTIYVFPVVSPEERFPPDGRARVWRSRDAGESWEELGRGLPDGFYAAVMRDAMCADSGSPAGVYFGSRDGSVYASNDDGDTWFEAGAHLPDVLSVRAAVL
ncbi:MAG: exo-alpha-sialidase [Actinomycetia bacterium]|nr:exo-alpha-sialidase [Actinomycetes bacterium]